MKLVEDIVKIFFYKQQEKLEPVRDRARETQQDKTTVSLKTLRKTC